MCVFTRLSDGETVCNCSAWLVAVYAEEKIRVTSIIYAVIELTLMVIICFGNILVIAAIFRCERLWTMPNHLILNLAIADLCIGLLMPLQAAMFLKRSILKNVQVCLFRYTSLLLFMSVSFLFLLAISYDRYMAVFWPLHYSIMNKRKHCVIIVLSWILPLIVMLIVPIFWHNANWKTCSLHAVLKREFICYLAIPLFILVLLLITCIYGMIFNKARVIAKEIRKTVPTGFNVPQTGFLRQDFKIAKTGGVVIGAFLICWVPFVVLSGAQAYGMLYNDQTLERCRTLASLLSMVNSALNPAIYAYRLPSFRMEFKRILRLKQDNNSAGISLTMP